eukprot:scaffold7339_cov249-Pinguiococcus_pyrenoidosus.AAC.28
MQGGALHSACGRVCLTGAHSQCAGTRRTSRTCSWTKIGRIRSLARFSKPSTAPTVGTPHVCAPMGMIGRRPDGTLRKMRQPRANGRREGAGKQRPPRCESAESEGTPPCEEDYPRAHALLPRGRALAPEDPNYPKHAKHAK